jgi:hypothetical protein
MALLDPAADARTPARAYLLTASQFADVAAQEMHRPPGTDLDLGDVVTSGRHQYGPGRYETLVRVGAMGGAPMLTITAPWRMAEVELHAPAPAYLRMLGAGLAEAHGWDRRRVAEHLAGLPGAAGACSVEQVLAVLAAVPPA